MALRDEKTSLGRKKEGDTVLQLGGGYFLKRMEQLDSFQRQPEGMEGKKQYGSVYHVQVHVRG